MFAAAVLYGCSSYDGSDNARFEEIPAEGWAYGDTVVFDISPDSVVETANSERRLALAVRHNSAYRYANLWVEINVNDGDTIYIDTLNVRLADKHGRRLGRGSGVSFIKVDTLPRVFARPSMVGVRHIMRVDTLLDVEQIGIVPIY